MELYSISELAKATKRSRQRIWKILKTRNYPYQKVGFQLVVDESTAKQIISKYSKGEN